MGVKIKRYSYNLDNIYLDLQPNNNLWINSTCTKQLGLSSDGEI